MNISLPYGSKHINFKIPNNMDYEILKPAPLQHNLSVAPETLIQKALANPIASPRLSELAKNKDTATIICSDHTRPVPSKYIIPPILKELRQGNPNIKITLLIATGCHRHTTKKELINKFGSEIVKKEHIIIHDCYDDSSMEEIGILPSGAKLIINKVAAKTNLLIAEGFIEPHFFAGFSGGRKCILPGICSRTTILSNHCAKFIDSPCARTGILKNNPIHLDMVEAAKLANLQFIVNIILDENHLMVAVFAGSPFKAHEAGCLFLTQSASVKTKRLGDIVITTNGGYPLDQNIYQCVKGLTAAESTSAPGAIIIIAAKCEDGTGGEHFYHDFADSSSPEQLLNKIRTIPQQLTQQDQWQSQILARILTKHQVIFISDISVKKLIEDMKINYMETLQAAMKQALKIKGNKAKVTIIPDGVSIIINPN